MCWYVLDMGQKEKHSRSGNSSNSHDWICRMHQVDSASHQIQPCKHVSDPTYGCTCSALMTILHNVLQTSTAHSSHLSFCSREERGRSRLPRTKCVGAGLPHDQCLQSAGALILDPMLYLLPWSHWRSWRTWVDLPSDGRNLTFYTPKNMVLDDDSTMIRSLGWTCEEVELAAGAITTLTVLTWVRLWRGYKSQELR